MKKFTNLIIAIIVIIIASSCAMNSSFENDEKNVSKSKSNETFDMFKTGVGNKIMGISYVTASGDDGNIAANTIDGDLSTRWSAEGLNQWIEFRLDEITTINFIDIAFYKGDQRTSDFKVTYFDGDNEEFDVFTTTSSGATSDFESFSVNKNFVRAIRIYGYGNSSNDWNSISEVKIWGAESVIDPVKQGCYYVSASSDDGNIAANAMDEDLSTRWSAEGDGQWIEFRLNDIVTVDYINIAFYKGDQRTSDFKITYKDGDNEEFDVCTTTSSGATSGFEAFSVNKRFVRAIRIYGYGNSINDWNSISEVEIWGN